MLPALAPDVAGGILLAGVPEDFAVVGADLGIRGFPPERAEHVERVLGAPQAEVDPAQAVLDVRVAGVELVGLLDEGEGFRQALVVIGQGVAQGVIGVAVIGAQLDEAAKVLFQDVQATDLLGGNGAVVEQVDGVLVVLALPDGTIEHVEGGLVAASFAQDLGAGDGLQLGFAQVAGLERGQGGQAGFGAALARQQAGPGQLGLEVDAAVGGHALQPLDGAGLVVLLLGDFGQEQEGVAVVALDVFRQGDVALQGFGGAGVVAFLVMELGQGVEGGGVVRLQRLHARERGDGGVVLFAGDLQQALGLEGAQVVGVFLQIVAQQDGGTLAAAGSGLQQLDAGQHGLDVVGGQLLGGQGLVGGGLLLAGFMGQAGAHQAGLNVVEVGGTEPLRQRPGGTTVGQVQEFFLQLRVGGVECAGLAGLGELAGEGRFDLGHAAVGQQQGIQRLAGIGVGGVESHPQAGAVQRVGQ